MPRPRALSPCTSLCLALGFAAMLAPSAAAQPAAGRVYVDEDYGFKVPAPSDWVRANPASIAVPGELCRAWSPDGTTTIVIFVQKPNQAVNPRDVLDQSTEAMKSSLGCDIQEQEIKKVAGMQAMWLAVTGNGTGGAIDGKGNVRTFQRWVAIPREADVIVLLLTAPEDEYKESDKVFQAMLKKLTVTGEQSAEQKSAK